MSFASSTSSAGPAAAITLRPARRDDIPAIDAMHFLSVQVLAGADYTPAEIEAFFGHLGTYDPSLIDEGTYFVAEHRGQLVASGGWSRRRPCLPDAEQDAALQDHVLSANSAKIRSVFVHPKYARLGLGSRIVRRAEAAAQAEGYRLLELWATLTGVPLYRKLGYQVLNRLRIPGGNGTELAALHMAKLIDLTADEDFTVRAA